MFELELFEVSKINSLRLIHLSTCLLGSLFLLFIWYTEKKKNKITGQDWGLVLISFALLLWAAMDAYRFLGLMIAGQVSLIIKTFSVYNNAFFIASLPFFKHSFEKTKQKFPLFGNKSNWIVTVLLSNVVIVLFYSLSWGQESNHSTFIKYFDVIYSAVTFVLLGYAITKSFQKRIGRNNPFMLVSILITILLIIPQFAFLPLFNVTYFDIISLILLISQFALVLLLLVLAQSWVVEETIEASLKDIIKLSEELAESRNSNSELQRLLEIKTNDNNEFQNKIAILKSQLSDSERLVIKQATLKDLSDREISVLGIINKSYQEIGDELFIARETVITHKKNIETKLGISGKESLIEFARQNGLLGTS